jgi:hypothetical protein
MQINTCWKDNSKYFPMSMGLILWDGIYRLWQPNLVDSHFCLFPNRAILNKGIYGYVLFLSKQVLDVQESYMYTFRLSLFGGC